MVESIIKCIIIVYPEQVKVELFPKNDSIVHDDSVVFKTSMLNSSDLFPNGIPIPIPIGGTGIGTGTGTGTGTCS